MPTCKPLISPIDWSKNCWLLVRMKCCINPIENCTSWISADCRQHVSRSGRPKRLCWWHHGKWRTGRTSWSTEPVVGAHKTTRFSYGIKKSIFFLLPYSIWDWFSMSSTWCTNSGVVPRSSELLKRAHKSCTWPPETIVCLVEKEVKIDLKSSLSQGFWTIQGCFTIRFLTHYVANWEW